MSNELISLLVLVLIFVIGTTMPVNMGVLGIVAAFIVGTAMGVSEDDIFAGFPGDLFVILVGVTYLFAIASGNGTVDWLIHRAVHAVGGRTAAIPWVMFLVTAALTASGAVVNGVVENNNLAENPTLLFISSFVFNLLLTVVVFFLFGGRKLLGRKV